MHMSALPKKSKLGRLACLLLACAGVATAAEPAWRPLFDGKSLAGWDSWLGPRSSGYLDPATTKEPPIGLNRDPLGVFTVVALDGQPAIRVSGEVFGAITTKESFGNFHMRLEYKWGKKKWPPREEPRHYRDTGILYWAIGPQGAGSYAWMRSVECNIMEKGVGQWWGVAGSYVDIEGRKVVLEKEPSIPYRGESPGETCVVYQPGGPQFTTAEGITSALDFEKEGVWNQCEVVAWGNVGIHLSNGKTVLALANPRYKEGDVEKRLSHGQIQLQSEGAEVFFRRIEIRPITGIPHDLMPAMPPGAPGEEGFTPLMEGANASAWAQAGPGSFSLHDGVASPNGGMGLWWLTNRVYTNFVLRGEFLQEQAGADSGIFVRFPNPGDDPWVAVSKGHEIEIGDPAATDPTWHTGAIYPFIAPAFDASLPAGKWNQYEIVCVGQDYSVRLNGKVVAAWSDPAARSAAGFIGLQNYNDGKRVLHRRLRVKELP